MDLSRRYLASIPPLPGAAPMRLENVRQLKINFPARPAELRVPVHMVEPCAQVQVAFPVQVRSCPRNSGISGVIVPNLGGGGGGGRAAASPARGLMRIMTHDTHHHTCVSRDRAGAHGSSYIVTVRVRTYDYVSVPKRTVTQPATGSELPRQTGCTWPWHRDWALA